QNPDNQFIGSTVRDDIAFGLENKLVPTEDMEAIIEEFAAKVGLGDYLDYEPQNLSGGQKQRVAIAGIMAMKPKIIIFDEATSMLDPKGKFEIKKLMYQLAEEEITVISITHDIEEVLQSDDCIVLNKGKLFMHDKPEKVFADAEKLRKINLDIPFTMQVKEVFRNHKIKLKAKDLKGMAEELWRSNSNH
ncbi:MAG: ATP-binding cassette domain-containing protein, partial [Erysipelotrichaceae bacterium]|nr:ATP-binding cassette domain-containing protein [Erysipelotrichaceae bacterium]